MTNVLVALGLGCLILVVEALGLCLLRAMLGGGVWVMRRLGFSVLTDPTERSQRLWAVSAVLTAIIFLHQAFPQLTWHRPTVMLVWLVPIALMLWTVWWWTHRRSRVRHE
jgi:hypothetical protein